MRKALRIAHRWIGLVLALPMLVQAITGCFLVATPVWEAMRPSPAVAVGTMHAASAILAAAATPGLVATRYQPAEPGLPAVVELGMAGHRGSQLQVFIDPVTLAVLGARQISTVYRWVHNLHESLLLPTMPGRSIVGGFGVGLLLLGLSGVVLWWPAPRPGRWRAAVSVGNGARGIRLQRELHGAVGFWVSMMLVIMSASGMTLAFPQTVRAMLGMPSGGPPRGEGHATLDIDAVVARAAEAVPGARLVDMRLPNPPGRPVFIRMERPNNWEGSPAIVAAIDPAGRSVLSVQDPRDQSPAAFSLAWVRALHFGDAFGLPWRVLVFLTSLGLPALAMTGTALWLLRRRNRHRLTIQRHDAMLGAAE